MLDLFAGDCHLTGTIAAASARLVFCSGLSCLDMIKFLMNLSCCQPHKSQRATDTTERQEVNRCSMSKLSAIVSCNITRSEHNPANLHTYHSMTRCLAKLALLTAALSARTCCHAFVHPASPLGQLSRQHPSSAAPTFTGPVSRTTTMQSSPFSIMKSEPASPEFSLLKQSQVLSAATGRPTTLADAFPSGGKKTIVAFFTHWGDFNRYV